MRIAILIDEYAPGAMPKIARNEKSELIKLGHEVDMVVCTKFDELPEDFIYPFPKWPKWRFPLFSFFSPQHILNIFFAKRLDYDLIIAHGMFAGLIAVHSGVNVNLIVWDPFSTMIHKIYWNTPLKFLTKLAEWFDIYIIKKADRVIISSSYHAKWFISFGIKYEIVYPGCHPNFSNKERKNIVLQIDRWDKGSQPVINASDTMNIIAGEWKYGLERYKITLGRSNVEKNHKIIGEVSEEELNELYDTAGKLLHCTPESFGLQGLEAAARGCPIEFIYKSGVNDIVPNSYPSEETFNFVKDYTWKRHVEELVK